MAIGYKKRPGARRKYSEDFVAMVFDLAKQGYTASEISRRMGIRYETVKRWLNNAELYCYEDEVADQLAKDMKLALYECYRRGCYIEA